MVCGHSDRRLRDFLNRLMCTLAAILFYLFPFLGVGDHPYKEDAFHQEASANYVDKELAAIKASECSRTRATAGRLPASSTIGGEARCLAQGAVRCDRSGQQELGQKWLGL